METLIAAASTFFLLIVATAILAIASYWVLFTKAGKPGWAAIIPIYNMIVMLEIAQKPTWWLVLMLLPGIQLIWIIWTLNLFVKRFGKSSGYTVGIIFLPFIFLPLLAFSKNTVYVGE